MEEIELPALAPMHDPAPWERLEGESEVNYARFLVYMHNRLMTIAEAAAELDLSYQHLRRVAQQHRWRARRYAYYLEEDIEARKQMRDRIAARTEAQLAGWEALIDQALAAIAKNAAKGNEITTRDAATMLKIAFEPVRVLQDQASRTIKHDFASMSDDQLNKLGLLLKDVDTGDE